MKRDPNNVEDLSREKGIDWDKEVKAGNLTPITPLARDTTKGYHIQGVPITDADAYIGADGQPAGKRIVPGKVMQHVAETGRYPSEPTGKASVNAPKGGWPRFGKDGKIVEETS